MLATLTLEQWSHVATIATGIAAVLALLLGIWQVNKSRLSQERQTTFEIYTQFLNRTLDHPEFLEADFSDDQIKRDPDKFAKYEVYIDLLIVTFEQLLKDDPHSLPLKSYLKSYLIGHRAYLCSERFQKHFLEQLEPELQAFVKKLCREWTEKSVVARGAGIMA